MTWGDDWLKNGLPIFNGGKDRSLARKMLDRVGGPQGFKTSQQTLPDGSVVTVQTKGTMAPQVTITGRAGGPDYKIREFCAIPKTLIPASIVNGVQTYSTTSYGARRIKYIGSKWVNKGAPVTREPLWYSVVPGRSSYGIESNPEGFFDVVSLHSGRLYVNEKALRELTLSGEIPLITYPPDVVSSGALSYPAESSDPGECYQIYSIGNDTGKRLVGNSTTTDEEWDFTSLELTVPISVITQFGSSVTTVTGAGSIVVDQLKDGAVWSAGEWTGRYSWWQEHVLDQSGASLVVSAKNNFATQFALDVESGVTLGNDSVEEWILRPDGIPTEANWGTEFVQTTESVSKPDPDYYYWRYSVVAEKTRFMSGPVSDVGGVTNDTTCTNNVTSSDIQNIGRFGGQTIELSRNASSSLNFRYRISHGDGWVKYQNDCRKGSGYWAATDWKVEGLFGASPPPENACRIANGQVKEFTNTTTATSTYSIDSLGVVLSSVSATRSYYRKENELTLFTYDIAANDEAWRLLWVNPESSYPVGSDRSNLAAASFMSGTMYVYSYYANNTTQTATGNSWVDSPPDDGTLSASARDYIYYDYENEVYVYVLLEVEASGCHPGGSGSSVLKLVVGNKGIEVVVPLQSSTGYGMLIGTREITNVALNQNKHPEYIEPITSPASFAPIGHQGMFKYIAYTTKQEEQDGVPPRFILSLPLFIRRFSNMGMAEAPSESHTCTAYNCTEIAALGGDTGVFTQGTEGKVFHVHVTQNDQVDWTLDVVGLSGSSADQQNHFSECYRT